MLYFFDDDELRQLMEDKGFTPFEIPPIDHTLETLELYWKTWEALLDPYLQELDEKVQDNPYLTVQERAHHTLLHRVGDILPHLKETVKFAKEIDKLGSLKDKLEYLDTYGGDDVMCVLAKDFAPYSFRFVMEKKRNDEWQAWFNGGLIYHGPHDRGGDGGPPTFSVNLEPHHGWSVHT